jgi:hypothetical protein
MCVSFDLLHCAYRSAIVVFGARQSLFIRAHRRASRRPPEALAEQVWQEVTQRLGAPPV